MKENPNDKTDRLDQTNNGFKWRWYHTVTTVICLGGVSVLSGITDQLGITRIYGTDSGKLVGQSIPMEQTGEELAYTEATEVSMTRRPVAVMGSTDKTAMTATAEADAAQAEMIATAEADATADVEETMAAEATAETATTEAMQAAATTEAMQAAATIEAMQAAATIEAMQAAATTEAMQAAATIEAAEQQITSEIYTYDSETGIEGLNDLLSEIPDTDFQNKAVIIGDIQDLLNNLEKYNQNTINGIYLDWKEDIAIGNVIFIDIGSHHFTTTTLIGQNDSFINGNRFGLENRVLLHEPHLNGHGYITFYSYHDGSFSGRLGNIGYSDLESINTIILMSQY